MDKKKKKKNTCFTIVDRIFALHEDLSVPCESLQLPASFSSTDTRLLKFPSKHDLRLGWGLMSSPTSAVTAYSAIACTLITPHFFMLHYENTAC